ncbi:MAG TPA: phospholipase, partial [Intrasporangium sp.]
MELSSRLGRLDAKLGDGLEAVLRSHHLRRLGELGWTDALTVPTEPGWWSTPVPVRPGNSLEVLIDGASALPQ